MCYIINQSMLQLSWLLRVVRTRVVRRRPSDIGRETVDPEVWTWQLIRESRWRFARLGWRIFQHHLSLVITSASRMPTSEASCLLVGSHLSGRRVCSRSSSGRAVAHGLRLIIHIASQFQLRVPHACARAHACAMLRRQNDATISVSAVRAPIDDRTPSRTCMSCSFWSCSARLRSASSCAADSGSLTGRPGTGGWVYRRVGCMCVISSNKAHSEFARPFCFCFHILTTEISVRIHLAIIG